MRSAPRRGLLAEDRPVASAGLCCGSDSADGQPFETAP